jgi:hypothetical protein
MFLLLRSGLLLPIMDFAVVTCDGYFWALTPLRGIASLVPVVNRTILKRSFHSIHYRV